MQISGILRRGSWAGVTLGLLSGCNSFDARPDPNDNGAHLVIPTDERAPLTAAKPPVPVSGGTLTVLADGSAAIVTDPNRDRVSIVDLASLTLRSTVTLQSGDEPGRSVEDGQKRIHVALRGSGAVVTIDTASGTIVDRSQVCRVPRGIAFDAATQLVHVACAEGKLVSLPAQGGAAVRSVTLEPDLRDVLVRGGELWVTRFKSAQVLRVNSGGTLEKRLSIPQSSGELTQPAPEGDRAGPGVSAGPLAVTLEAAVAWRAVPSADGGAVVVHQQAVLDEVPVPEPSSQGSAYGGDGQACGGIVRNVVSRVAPDGSVVSTPLNGAPLPVDVAVSADGAWVAVAHAGPLDTGAPRPFMVFPHSGGDEAPMAGPSAFGAQTSVSLVATASLTGNGGCAFAQGAPFNDPVTAVAFTSQGRLLAQTQDPPQLLVMSGLPFGDITTIPLPGESQVDTGQDLFQRDAGGGIACASCHPEGGEDGRTWHFIGAGDRRTQALHVGLKGTAPFHWNGDLADVGELMGKVFVGRMGGVRETNPRIDALSNWLFAIKRPPAIRDAADPAVGRGQALFESATVGCSSCHSGEKLTNNQTVAIDTQTKLALQVPSLIAVGYRSPFMHDGCAATLADRFNPACGGDAHGNTDALSSDQRADLIAYLESL